MQTGEAHMILNLEIFRVSPLSFQKKGKDVCYLWLPFIIVLECLANTVRKGKNKRVRIREEIHHDRIMFVDDKKMICL